MREGLDGDDIYIMVEDEFQAIAQSFTRHLHYAEYKRKTKQAQIDNATKINDLARPTDIRTAMRTETRRKKDAQSMSERHKLALEKMKGPASERRPAVDSEEEDTRMEEDEEDDPWLGTSLQGLMTKSIKSQSLVGLQGIQSTTKAGAGFSKSSGSKSRSLSSGAKHHPYIIDDDATASGGDDDLDTGPSRLPIRKNSTPSRRDPPLPPTDFGSRESSSTRSERDGDRTPRATMGPPSRSSTNKPSQDRSSTPKTMYRSRMSLPFDEFDDHSASRREKEVSRRHSLYSRTVTPKKEDQQDGERAKKTRFNEVPIFLT
jgi:hypothetical protein